MAVDTAGDAVFGKLLSVYVFMTLLALLGSGLEVDVDQLGFEVRRLVAIDARSRAMRARQLEIGLRVIEGGQLLPRLRGVARFASRGRTVGPLLLHPVLELPFMRIGVATRAIQILPVVDRRWLGLKFSRLLVAIGAGSRQVAAGEDEARLLVIGDGKGRRFISVKRVAAIAGVEIGSSHELSGVLVGVAVRAVLELHLEKRVFALGNVTLRALDTRVPSLQRIRTGRMFFHRE